MRTQLEDRVAGLSDQLAEREEDTRLQVGGARATVWGEGHSVLAWVTVLGNTKCA